MYIYQEMMNMIMIIVIIMLSYKTGHIGCHGKRAIINIRLEPTY